MWSQGSAGDQPPWPPVTCDMTVTWQDAMKESYLGCDNQGKFGKLTAVRPCLEYFLTWSDNNNQPPGRMFLQVWVGEDVCLCDIWTHLILLCLHFRNLLINGASDRPTWKPSNIESRLQNRYLEVKQCGAWTEAPPTSYYSLVQTSQSFIVESFRLRSRGSCMLLLLQKAPHFLPVPSSCWIFPTPHAGDSLKWLYWCCRTEVAWK